MGTNKSKSHPSVSNSASWQSEFALNLFFKRETISKGIMAHSFSAFLKPCARTAEGPLTVSWPQQWYEQQVKAPDWKQFRFHLSRSPQDRSAGNQPGWLPWLIKCQRKRMERMPKAWESRRSYFSKEFQVCDPRSSNRKCVCVCEWASQPPKRKQQRCWFITRAWENVFSETFPSLSTNASPWAFYLSRNGLGGRGGLSLEKCQNNSVARADVSCKMPRFLSYWKSATLPKWEFVVWNMKSFCRD